MFRFDEINLLQRRFLYAGGSVPGMSFPLPGMSFSYPGMSFSYPGMSFSYPGMSFSYPGMSFPATVPARSVSPTYEPSKDALAGDATFSPVVAPGKSPTPMLAPSQSPSKTNCIQRDATANSVIQVQLEVETVTNDAAFLEALSEGIVSFAEEHFGLCSHTSGKPTRYLLEDGSSYSLVTGMDATASMSDSENALGESS